MGLNSIDSPVRVLVVDDYAAVADGLADFLESAHFDVAVAYTAASAVSIACHYRPDAVITDVVLPDMTGYELANRIRQTLPRSPAFVAFTAYNYPSYEQRSVECRFAAHILKPGDPRAIEEILRRAVAAARC